MHCQNLVWTDVLWKTLHHKIRCVLSWIGLLNYTVLTHKFAVVCCHKYEFFIQSSSITDLQALYHRTRAGSTNCVGIKVGACVFQQSCACSPALSSSEQVGWRWAAWPTASEKATRISHKLMVYALLRWVTRAEMLAQGKFSILTPASRIFGKQHESNEPCTCTLGVMREYLRQNPKRSGQSEWTGAGLEPSITGILWAVGVLHTSPGVFQMIYLGFLDNLCEFFRWSVPVL